MARQSLQGFDPATDRPDVARSRGGRPPITSRAQIEQVAFRLFDECGFDETSVDDIAACANISRRTFFRYYRSKFDIVWGDFDSELSRMRAWFDSVDPQLPMMEAVHQGVLVFNRLPDSQRAEHRRRMRLILGVPSLLANSTLRLAQWRAEIARFTAGRLGLAPDDLLPKVIGYSALGAALAAYEQWLDQEGAELEQLLDAALGELAIGFKHAGT